LSPKGVAEEAAPLTRFHGSSTVSSAVDVVTPAVVDDSTVGPGVSTIRKLLSIPVNSPLPNVPTTSLPTVISSLSSCKLINDEVGDGEQRPRGNSIADNMTISSVSLGFLASMQKE